MRIEVLLLEEELREEFVLCLKRSELPERFSYWFPRSVYAWLSLCNSTQYRNYDRSLDLIRESARDIVDHINLKALGWISLGCGQGTKEPHFLRMLEARGTKVYYQPVDISYPLLELACRAGEMVGVNTIGFKADFRRRNHLECIRARVKDIPAVFSLFGNTVGSAPPRAILQPLREIMGPGDYLLVDGELFSSNTTLAGYDNPDNLAFAIAPLREIGLTGSDGKLEFDLVNEGEGLYYVRKRYTFSRDVELDVLGERFRFKAGREFVMSRSYKYSVEMFSQMLTDTGFQIVDLFKSRREPFLLTLARTHTDVDE